MITNSLSNLIKNKESFQEQLWWTNIFFQIFLIFVFLKKKLKTTIDYANSESCDKVF